MVLGLCRHVGWWYTKIYRHKTKSTRSHPRPQKETEKSLRAGGVEKELVDSTAMRCIRTTHLSQSSEQTMLSARSRFEVHDALGVLILLV